MSAPIALVTGATSGIGRAAALRLAADGFHLVCAGRNAERGAATVQAIEEAGGSAEFRGFDIVEEAAWEEEAEYIIATHGRLDALVNCAGAFFTKPLPDTTLAEFQSLWRTDVESVVLGTKWGLRAMRDTRSAGSIVNVSSLAGVIGLEDCAAYCAAKAAVTQLSKVAALEGAALEPKVRVNSLNPGVILTEMITNAYGDGEAVRQFVMDGNALMQVGLAEDIANACAFLAGPAARMVTGAIMIVDGGRGAD